MCNSFIHCALPHIISLAYNHYFLRHVIRNFICLIHISTNPISNLNPIVDQYVCRFILFYAQVFCFLCLFGKECTNKTVFEERTISLQNSLVKYRHVTLIERSWGQMCSNIFLLPRKYNPTPYCGGCHSFP